VVSVREHGVLQPITGIRTPDGVEVRDGQRRTLAARQAGLPTSSGLCCGRSRGSQNGDGRVHYPADRHE
jgi:hypothetical protein